MDKKKVVLLVSGASVIVLAIIGALYYFYIAKPDQQQEIPVAETTEVPQYGTDSPLQKKPELNPVEKTNPFSDIRTNPFE